MKGSSEEKRMYILFGHWKNFSHHVDVENFGSKNLCHRTECGVRKHFQKVPVFKGLQFCTVCIQERNTTKMWSEAFTLA